MKATQVERLVAYLRSHPGASGMELVTALSMPKYTSRISDARAAGHVIDCRKDADGVSRYTVREATPGVARFQGNESKPQVERQMAEAFAPVTAMREAWDRVFGGDS